MTGYTPNYHFLEQLGIDISEDESRTPVTNEDNLESSVKGLYLAGVVVSGLQTSKLFIENTRHHGEKIILDIMTNINP